MRVIAKSNHLQRVKLYQEFRIVIKHVQVVDKFPIGIVLSLKICQQIILILIGLSHFNET